jgi:hypothetical protein
MILACQPDPAQKQESTESPGFISESSAIALSDSLISEFSAINPELIHRGVKQIARLWREEDGSMAEFSNFCRENLAVDAVSRQKLFQKLERNYELLWGNSIKLLLELREPVDMAGEEVSPVDLIFSGYNPQAHLDEDLYKNKIAFITALNFPTYSLLEKQSLGADWTSLEWAYARMGDLFTSRIPAAIIQNDATASSQSDAYISSYNIYMGKVLDQQGETQFGEDKVLITHWNLRDELKSNYQDENAQHKQDMIYQVMLRIIDQSIPKEVINSGDYEWDVFGNKLYQSGQEVQFTPEENQRYQYLLNNFKAKKAYDPYTPLYPSYIERMFSGNMEITKEDIQKIFRELVSSPQAKEVGELIQKQLGRDLRPYDIWYNGFKAKSSFTEDQLDELLRKKYPNSAALEADLPRILRDLQFTPEQANFLASRIRVDASRGAGHAWGAEMRSEKARLRTRIAENGMNYKGYNIAVHEFGHNVEQTITLHHVDHYMMHGVPNTAFTEALAFIFQARDLKLLGLEEANADKVHMQALANFWSSYEIMGVSLVDIAVWEWMYANPDADANALKEAVIRIAKEIWNEYYAPVFGEQDSPILAIYSHMIDNPLYLSAYPIGHLIDFQIEQQIKGKNFAEEVYRIYTAGRLAPQLWLKKAVGSELSVQALMDATTEAVKAVK